MLFVSDEFIARKEHFFGCKPMLLSVQYCSRHLNFSLFAGGQDQTVISMKQFVIKMDEFDPKFVSGDFYQVSCVPQEKAVEVTASCNTPDIMVNTFEYSPLTAT